MAVLHIVQFSLPEITSGYTIRTQAIVKEQRSLGLNPIVVTSPRHPTPDDAEVDGIPHYRSGPERVAALVWLRDAARVSALCTRITEVAADRGDIKVLHAHSPVLCGLAALSAGGRLGLPVVYEVRGLWEEAMLSTRAWRRWSPRYILARTTETRVCRRANAVVTISHALRREFAKRGVAESKLRTVPNGVDTETFSPRQPTEAWRRPDGLSGGPLIMYLGALRQYEGIDVLLDAFELVRKRVEEAQLLIVGDGEHKEPLAERVRASEPGVRLLQPVPHSETPEVYASAQIVVYPRISTRATELVTPLKPLEAMAMGKPIIASDVGGLRELLTDGETARLFPAGSATGLADVCLELLSDEKQRRMLGENARKLACTRFDWKAIVPRFSEIYRAAAQPG